jgi:hypothetical protein
LIHYLIAEENHSTDHLPKICSSQQMAADLIFTEDGIFTMSLESLEILSVQLMYMYMMIKRNNEV